MRIIYTFEKLDELSNAIFLAGGTYRTYQKNTKKSWREIAIKYLKKLGYNGDIIIPEYRDNIQPKDFDLKKQIDWELEGLYKSSKILYWIPRNMDDLPCLTTNIEFGNFIDNFHKKIYVGGNNVKNDYIKYRLKEKNKPFYSDIAILIATIIDEDIQYIPNIWFTSDTHFTQERTLELSKRPFNNVREMDLNLISNWNSNVSYKDTIYHLGDFGNINIFDVLNCKKMYFVNGNYEDDGDIILNDGRIINLHNKCSLRITKDMSEIELVHKPSDHTYQNVFYLFGHIHKLQMIKRYGLNVGVDCHNYTPISLDDVLFYKNAIERHYDENVFI